MLTSRWAQEFRPIEALSRFCILRVVTSDLPAPVDGIGDVLALSGGYDHVCAILPDETARCWGRNREGQIGDGSDQRERPLPIAPIGLGPVGGQQ